MIVLICKESKRLNNLVKKKKGPYNATRSFESAHNKKEVKKKKKKNRGGGLDGRLR